MKDDPVTDASLRQFLLGQIDDNQRQRIESLFLTDPEFNERLLAVEQDLIEDYLEDSFTKADREAFLLHFAQTVEQQRKLRITGSVKDWARNQANRQQVSPPGISVWGRLLAGIRLKPVLVFSIAATAMIAIVVAVLWVNYRADRRHLNAQQELARLNDPANLSEPLPHMYSLELSPVAVRSAETETALNRSNIEFVELRLRWIQKEDNPEYRALVRRFDDEESFTVQGLRSIDGAGKVIRLRIPVSLLKRGLNRIELTNVDANGAVAARAEYTFNVSG